MTSQLNSNNQPVGNAVGAWFEANAFTPASPGQTHSEELILSNFINSPEGNNSGRCGCRMAEIASGLFEITGGWPRRVGEQLFCTSAAHKVVWLDRPAKLFAWIDNQAPVLWARGTNMITQERFFHHLQMTCECYDTVEVLPHFPALPNTYYAHPPIPTGDGSCFQELANFFSPSTEVDRTLIRAFFASLFWGGKPGSRPAWLILGADDDPDRGRGVGKSTLVEIVGALAGGFLDIQAYEDMTAVKKRLLSPTGRSMRMVRLDNVKTHRLSWGEAEGLITSPTISGHQMYEGEGRRPNTLTWGITLNGANLSQDLAQRCVIVHLERPKYSSEWRKIEYAFIQQNLWQIIGDIGQILAA